MSSSFGGEFIWPVQTGWWLFFKGKKIPQTFTQRNLLWNSEAWKCSHFTDQILWLAPATMKGEKNTSKSQNTQFQHFLENKIHLLGKLTYIKEDTRHWISGRWVCFSFGTEWSLSGWCLSLFVCKVLGTWVSLPFLCAQYNALHLRRGQAPRKLWVENFKWLARGLLLARSPEYFLRLRSDLTGTEMGAFPGEQCRIVLVSC